MKNANKSPKILYPLFRNGNGSGKVIRNPYPGPNHRQKPAVFFPIDRLNHNISMKSADILLQ